MLYYFRFKLPKTCRTTYSCSQQEDLDSVRSSVQESDNMYGARKGMNIQRSRLHTFRHYEIPVTMGTKLLAAQGFYLTGELISL